MNKIVSLILLSLYFSYASAGKPCYWSWGEGEKLIQLTYSDNVIDCDTWAKGVWKEISGDIWSPSLCWSGSSKTCGLIFGQTTFTYWEQKAGYYDCLFTQPRDIYQHNVVDGKRLIIDPYDFCWKPKM
ncbi:hypothetical protein HK098_001917 [Nowakowskiella sp. JEL0407]|nr:hypothetical protein HK098_001917 [Nowakowskiella sp. JEL0407]